MLLICNQESIRAANIYLDNILDTNLSDKLPKYSVEQYMYMYPQFTRTCLHYSSVQNKHMKNISYDSNKADKTK